MLKKNVEGLEKMAAGYLQYKYSMYLRWKNAHGEEEARPDFVYYCGACRMLEAMGATWERTYRGKTPEDLDNPEMYSHWVRFPSDEHCKRLNFDAWAE